MTTARDSFGSGLLAAVLLAGGTALYGGATVQAQTAPVGTQAAPVGSSAAAAQATGSQDATTDTSAGAPAAGAPATANAAAGTSKVDNAHYVIGPDDMLQVTVWREPTLSGSMPVRPDGMITLVLIGDLKAAGQTPMQLGQNIAERLKHYIQDPVVSVAVTADTSQRIYMVGEVGHVGPIPLSPGMTPLQAISAAGGPNPYANVKRIYILRGTGARQQKIPFNYKQALKGDARQSPTLQPGDTIVVP